MYDASSNSRTVMQNRRKLMTETTLSLQNFFLQNNNGSEHSDNEFQYPDSII